MGRPITAMTMTDHMERALLNYRWKHHGDVPSGIHIRRDQLDKLIADSAPKLGRIVTPSGETYAYDGIPLRVD